jgi:anti-sigma B factor antagonist
MALVHVSIREGDGQVVVVLRGVLDVADAVGVAAALATVAAPERRIIVDLAGLAFMDSSGVAALVHGRKHARVAGGELLLAAPQPEVLRVLVLTHLIDVFRVCADVGEAARSVSDFPQVAAPMARRRAILVWPWPARRQGRPTGEREGQRGSHVIASR